MPRGRQHVPSVERDGTWFPHPGDDSLHTTGCRTKVTSTGRMLSCAQQSNPKTYPIPNLFNTRGSRNYKRANGFSLHDNRHVFQDSGEYFVDEEGQRLLGKRLRRIESRQHCTHKDMLKHCDRAVMDYDYNTTYELTNQGRPGEERTLHRRFPKQHSSESGAAKPAPTISEWFPHIAEPHRIPLQVLASSQEPFPKHNAWKYSKNGLHRVYPSYNNRMPFPPPIFNKYGTSFMTGC